MKRLMTLIVIVASVVPAEARAFTWTVMTIAYDRAQDDKKPGAAKGRPTTTWDTGSSPGKTHIPSPSGWSCTLRIDQIDQIRTMFRQSATVACQKGETVVSVTATMTNLNHEQGDQEFNIETDDGGIMKTEFNFWLTSDQAAVTARKKELADLGEPQ